MRGLASGSLSAVRVTCWPTIGAKFDSKTIIYASSASWMGKPAESIERPAGLLIGMPKNGKGVCGSLRSAWPRPKFGAKLKVKVVSKLPSWAKPKPRIWSPRNVPAPGDGKKNGVSGKPNLPTFWYRFRRCGVLTLIGVPTSADRLLEPKNPGLVVKPALAVGLSA